MLNRIKRAVFNETGASNLEIIVWMSVVLVIAGFLFAFRNKIAAFIQSVTGKVDSMQGTLEQQFDAGNDGLPPLGGGGGGD